MLLDRGPIEPLDVDALIQSSSLPALDGMAAQLAADLGAHASAIDEQLMTIGSDDQGADVAEGGLDLAAAQDELDRQAGALDGSIGDVAAASDVQDSDIPGLSSEAAADAEASTAIDWPGFVSHEPDLTQDPRPPHPDPQDPHPDPAPSESGDPFTDAVRALYASMLNRDPSPDEIEIHRGNPGGIEGVRETILHSAEYRQLHGGEQR
jgi:hypothetical protein